MTVADHGPGVEPSEIELITNKFYRGTKNTTVPLGSKLVYNR
jgi:signal transduction histidine kinase